MPKQLPIYRISNGHDDFGVWVKMVYIVLVGIDWFRLVLVSWHDWSEVVVVHVRCSAISCEKNGPCHEKNCIRGFRPGPTKTRLYNHKNSKMLEIPNLEIRGIIIVLSMMRNKGADQSGGLPHLCFRIWKKQTLSRRGLSD